MNNSSLPNHRVDIADSAFTLVEILIVISIIAILASMTMPIITIAQRSAKKTATRSVMHKLDTALHLFRTDISTFPYQRSYADTSLGEQPTNRLYHHLGTRLSAAEVIKLHQDADAAAARYDYPLGADGNGNPTEFPACSSHVFRESDIKPAPSTAGVAAAWAYVNLGGGVWGWRPNLGSIFSRISTCVMLNRMGAERARLAVWSGNVDVTGCRLLDAMHPIGGIFMAGRDNSSLELLAVKQTDAKPGWGNDYLNGELESRYIDGETVLDAWRRPIIYVAQIVEGMRGTRGYIMRSNLHWIDSRIYGLDKQGRRSLAPVDPFSGAPITADGAYLPDPAQLMTSDRRRWAAPGWEHGYELWSAGPDGAFDWMRPHRKNIDNVSLEPYDKDLQP